MLEFILRARCNLHNFVQSITTPGKPLFGEAEIKQRREEYSTLITQLHTCTNDAQVDQIV